jgi:hypothetical protein
MEAPWLRLPAECQEPTCIAVERCPRESWPAIEPHAAADHRRSGQAGAARWPPRGHLLLRLGEREEVRREDRNIRKALQPCEKDMKSIPLYKNRKGNTTPGSAPPVLPAEPLHTCADRWVPPPFLSLRPSALGTGYPPVPQRPRPIPGTPEKRRGRGMAAGGVPLSHRRR